MLANRNVRYQACIRVPVELTYNAVSTFCLHLFFSRWAPKLMDTVIVWPHNSTKDPAVHLKSPVWDFGGGSWPWNWTDFWPQAVRPVVMMTMSSDQMLSCQTGHELRWVHFPHNGLRYPRLLSGSFASFETTMQIFLASDSDLNFRSEEPIKMSYRGRVPFIWASSVYFTSQGNLDLGQLNKSPDVWK